MNIETPLRSLGAIDASALIDAVLARDDDAWLDSALSLTYSLQNR